MDVTTTFTLRRRDRSSAHVLDGTGRVVGHVGLMAGGAMVYVNGGTLVPGFASHSTTLDGALAEFIRVAERNGGGV